MKTITKSIPASSSESKLESPGNAVATPVNDCGFVVNENLNYWSLFGLIPLLAAIMARGIRTNIVVCQANFAGITNRRGTEKPVRPCG
ncbi:DUF2214 family protein [Nostoc favosum]|uniref:DUF2214 family protein n=1 Tax=Nostoc favosum CHAB5714 TaxID=2780399 RepID=A0ABS8ILA4_9NOSO|nr:DUF2214 family protein [Nostoc favosum]MCC5605042.1 DUF2214 family protein [Nostoc favosum CHAB5714]